MKKVAVGLEILINDDKLQKKFKGKVALLCHNASVDSAYIHATLQFKKIFGSRFIKIFGPQHGFYTDSQDNMVETDHFIHPYFNLPVYSLYSQTRIPTDEMLEGIDHLFVDLQDVGCRVYTYIYTLTLLLEKSVGRAIEIIILDRPNPLNGIDVEGNISDEKFRSFVGRHPIPMRHGMTIAEVGLMHQQYWTASKVKLAIIKMQGWQREMFFDDANLPWLLPSPNLARFESTLTFPANVLFEGTRLSEGRGTAQALEIIGHPNIEPYSLYFDHLKSVIENSGLCGIIIRPITFLPSFQKHTGVICGGFQLHVTDRKVFKPWRFGQLLMRELYYHLKDNFQWKDPPYEYNYEQKPIDLINGTDRLRHWVESRGSMEELNEFEKIESYRDQLSEVKLY